MNSLRFNPSTKWNDDQGNRYFLGFMELIFDIFYDLKNTKGKKDLKMLEIGSYKGESTFLFASSGIFKEIHCIDPYEGAEEANSILQENWGNVKQEFITNTRYFNNITLHKDYSYNIYNNFPDQYFDFIYIDACHEYEDVKKDIQLYLPKTNHLIGGHDYQKEWPGVVKAVDEILGTPHKIYGDDSFIINTQYIR
tara:strand:- start:422 stop:1006 length:585 start_codon:yes stop_codon:yes gene_type:complete